MTLSTSRTPGLAAFVALAASLLLSVDAEAAPVAGTPAAPDLELVSVATSHSELAPSATTMVTFVVRATGAPAGPFSVGAYYDKGVAVPHGPPKTAQLIDTYLVERGLKKDQTAAFQMSVKIPPCDACGPHTLYVVADIGVVVLDVSRANNVRTIAFDVAQDHLPNLRVTALSLDKDRGATSDKVGIRGTVKNDSKYYAEGPFRISAYCSADRALKPRDHRLFSFMVPALAAGQTVGLDRAIQLEPECGVYAATTWVGLLADDQDAVPEANEQDNGEATPYWVFRAPELTSRLVVLSATSGPVGSRVLVSYRVANQGGSAAGAFRTGVYLARPGEPLRKGTLLDSVAVPSLAASTDSGLIQHLVTIPNVPRGRYALGVWVDIDAENGELHRRNDFKADPFDVTEVNLTDVHFTAQRKEVAPGSDVELRLAVHDTGRSAAPATKVGLYYSDDPRFDRGEDARIGEVSIEGLPAGGSSHEKTVTVAIPKDAREGYRFLLAVIDDTDVVAETDERDNVALEPILVLPPDRLAGVAR